MGYTIKEIQAARAYIRNVAISDIFANKGGASFTSLNGRDIENLFNLYDITFFQGQIREKIEGEFANLEFYARSRTSGAGGVCGVKKESVAGLPQGQKMYACTYFLDIAPNVLESIFRTNAAGLPTAAGVGCSDRLGCLQIIMEHEIVHLLMISWGYSSKSVSNPTVYGSHGLLFQCMIEEYFGHARFDHDLGLTIVMDDGKHVGNLPDAFMRYRMEKGSLAGVGFQNWAASCYLDSILMVLFDNISPFWRKNIMDVNVDTIEYSRSVCDTKSKVDTIDKLKDHAKKIQDQMKIDYKTLHADKKIIKCTILRHLLSECLPSMKPNGSWVMFNTGATYEAIANIFPGLLIDVPIQINRWSDEIGDYIPDSVDYAKEALLTMWDYLDPLIDIEERADYKEIRWDLMDSSILVFYNGAIPRIRKFNESGNEDGYVYINGEKHSFDVTKARKFDYTIIDGRYRLIGVVTLEGVSPTSEGGSHYTAHFLGTDNKWYYYNDLGAIIKPVNGSLPLDGVWIEENHKMPSMYFYQKIAVVPHSPIPKKSRSPSPVKSTKRKEEVYQGRKLRYRKSLTPVDGSVIYFVHDETSNISIVPHLDKLSPLTKVDDRTRMWNLPLSKTKQFEEKIKILDYEQEKQDVELGKIYRSYPNKKIEVRNYTENTFVISGTGADLIHRSSVDLQNEKGMEIKNLKHGIAGTGYVYHKSKLHTVIDLLDRM
jgi:hypothetical protein